MDYRSVAATCAVVIVVFAALVGLSFMGTGGVTSSESRDSISSQATGDIFLRR